MLAFAGLELLVDLVTAGGQGKSCDEDARTTFDQPYNPSGAEAQESGSFISSSANLDKKCLVTNPKEFW